MPEFVTRPALTLALCGALAAAGTAAAEPPRFSFPVACEPDRNCWVVNYVDLDPGPGVRDFACGGRTYDGHKGTDVALRDLKAMSMGVFVLAGAAGQVKAARDGMEDAVIAAVGRDTIKGRECGNGVVLDHGDGWETQYCHLRKGSIGVAVGDIVEAGQSLGLVGLSGLTEFPHAHFEVRYLGKVVDPFVGPEREGPCGPGRSSLWQPATQASLSYRQVVLFNAGFTDSPPSTETLRAGDSARAELPRSAQALVFWVESYGVEAGDVIRLRITGPEGQILVDAPQTMDRAQAYRNAFAGRPVKGGAWAAGRYRGEATLTRSRAAGTVTESITAEVEIR